MLRRIISGGQTGVDRGALDAALELGFPCGGACPAGRIAEDGRVPDRYPLFELKSMSYRSRTLRNVADSDGTVILPFGELEGGTATTRDLCTQLGKPAKLINGAELGAEPAAAAVLEFVAKHRIAVLNVAGPRASRMPQAHAYTYAVIRNVLMRSA